MTLATNFGANFAGGNILHYDGTTGAFIGEYITAGSGGLNFPATFVLGKNRQVYVLDVFPGQILRYNGRTGGFLKVFAAGPPLDIPIGMTFMPRRDD